MEKKIAEMEAAAQEAKERKEELKRQEERD